MTANFTQYFETKIYWTDEIDGCGNTMIDDFLDATSFITEDKTIQGLLKNASLDPAIICALISRTVYPWSGSTKTITEKQMEKYFDTSSVTKDKPELCEHFKMLGHFLSVADRIGGYALGDFGKAMEMAKMNAHASGWHPALIVRRSVSFFEDMLNNDAELCELLLNSIP